MCNFAPNDKQPMNKQDWTYKKLGEVCETSSGGTPSKSHKEYYEGGTIPWLRSGEVSQGLIYNTELFITDLGLEKSSAKIFPVDTVVIAMYGATVGQVGLLKKEMATNQAVCGIFPNNSLYPLFLLYTLKSKKSLFLKDAVGGAQPNISQNLIKNTIIPVPPIGEQERIVAELDLLQGIIEKKKEQLKAYDQLAQSIFYTMFGDPIDNPKGWETKTIGNTCTITCGQDYKTVEDENGKYPIYGTGGIMGWANQFRCPKDSVIIGRKGNINNPILVDVDFWNVDTAFGVTPNNEVLSAIYFFFFCKEYDFTQHDVSVTIPSLRRTDILKIKIPVPPLSLQEEFAEKVEAIERQKALVQQSIEETQTMFDCTMDKYFG